MYAVPPETFVDDPFSLGLVTFTDMSASSSEIDKLEWPTLAMRIHGVTARVPARIGQFISKK